MKRTTKIALWVGGIFAAAAAALGLAASAEAGPKGPTPKRPAKRPGKLPGNPPVEPPPETPPPEPPPTEPVIPPPGDDNGGTTPSDDNGGTTPGGDNGGASDINPFVPVTPNIPIISDPVDPEPGGLPTLATWGPRHALLKAAGYWEGATYVQPSADTVDAIQTFQLQTEAARNQLQGNDQTAWALSQQYGVVVPDGKWGPQTAAWLQWASQNRSKHNAAVVASTGQPAGWSP